MDENATPEQQATSAPAQQEGSVAGSTGQTSPPEGYVEKARFDGLLRKVQALTEELRSANDNLAAKSSEVEQLRKQLAEQQESSETAVGEAQSKVDELTKRIEELESARGRLESLSLKLKVAKEMGRPELAQLIDKLPDITDEEQIKSILSDFASFADSAARARENQLLSGIMPEALGGGLQPPSRPTTPQGWIDLINSLPLGSPEREKALEDYGRFVNEYSSRGN